MIKTYVSAKDKLKDLAHNLTKEDAPPGWDPKIRTFVEGVVKKQTINDFERRRISEIWEEMYG